MAVEIDEAELVELQRAHALLSELSTKPEAKKNFERALKTIVPTIETDEDRQLLAEQLAAPHISRVNETADRLEKLLKAQEDRETVIKSREVEQGLENAFSKVRKMGFNDEGLEAVKRLMVERQIADPEAAAALIRMNEPVQEVRSWQSPMYNPSEGVTDVKKLFADEDRWLDDEIGATLRDMRLSA
jgi:HD superfamily phosphohydrolase